MIRIAAYDKDFAWRGTVPFISAEFTKRFNQAGAGSFVVPLDAPRFSDLVADGARVVMTATSRRTGYVETFSGRISQLEGQGPRDTAVTFTVADDAALWSDFLCWVVPGQPITSQGIAGTHDTRTGPAETVVKQFVDANAIDRLGLPIVLGADLGRGPTITLKMRFYTLADKAFAAVDGGAGLENGTLAFTVQQDGDHLLVDCHETALNPVPLSVRAGSLDSWSYVKKAPTVTDVVVAGQGEGTLRLLRQRSDAARAAAQNWRWERFRDARDTDEPDVMYARADEVMADGDAKAGVRLTFRESDGLGYGSPGTRPGDRVQIAIRPDVVIGPEIVREVTFSHTRSAGFTIRPSIGDRSDEAGPLVSTVKRIVQYLRRWNP